jgi:hypothetical protein
VRRLLFLAAAGLWLASAAPPAAADPAEAACGNHGTAVAFVDSPSEAARQALKEEKLVFVLHVSGNFEDPRFT